MNKYIIFLLLVSIFSCKSETNQNEIQEQLETFDLVLTNGNVIDLESGEITQQTIFINKDKIDRISSSDEEESYTALKSYDISGKYVLPGFWDNHVHFRGGDSLIDDNKDFLKLFIENGITTVRDAGGDLTMAIMDWQKEIEDGELVGPTIFTSGPKIDGQDARWAGSLEVETDEDIIAALDSLQKLRVDFVKLYDSTISSEAYLQTIREAEKRGMITSGHMPFSVTLEETVNSGLDAVEHLYYILKGCSSEEAEITNAIKKGELGFWDSMSRLTATYNDSIAGKTFEMLKTNEVFVVPTLHIGNVLSYLDEQDHSEDDYLQLMSDGIIKTYEGRINSALNSSAKAKKDRKYLNLFFKNLVISMNTSGVKLLAGSDCGAYNSYVYPGISLHQELEALVATGITPLEALKTSAYNGATFLKKNQDYGSLEEGKMADLVVLNSNPLEDIKNTRNINKVVKLGWVVDSSSISE